MTTNTITAADTFTIYGRVLNDFADGDVSTITFPNKKYDMKTGKNRNSIFTRNAAGENADATLRLIRGSSDDQFMLQQLSSQDSDFPSTVLATGEFVKRLGDGQGNVVRDVYTLSGGIITTIPDTKENVEGDKEQAVSVYKMMFALAVPSIQ